MMQTRVMVMRDICIELNVSRRERDELLFFSSGAYSVDSRSCCFGLEMIYAIAFTLIENNQMEITRLEVASSRPRNLTDKPRITLMA